ncbi:MAG: hypothetical protein R6V12_05140 [Candidatus Hydrogenedentota bacterium]
MNKVLQLSLVLLVSITLAGTALAAEKAQVDEDQDWEKHPEPALQVFKTTGRGIHALVYHSLESLKEGNEHFPLLGSVKIFEGIGKGLVELSTSAYKGMAGSKPKQYDELSKANEVIDEDPLLRNTRQVVGTTVGTAGTGFTPVAILYASQKATDQFPREEEEIESAQLYRKPEKKRMTVEEAQRRYVGQRAEYGKKIERGRGNLLKQLRLPPE